jgi:hypothetical protein
MYDGVLRPLGRPCTDVVDLQPVAGRQSSYLGNMLRSHRSDERTIEPGRRQVELLPHIDRRRSVIDPYKNKLRIVRHESTPGSAFNT